MKKEKFKSLFYNNCPELMFFLGLLFALAISLLFSQGNYGVFVEFIVVAFLFYIWKYKGRKANKGLYYFKCSYSLFAPNSVWINQNVKKNRDMNKCPQREFVRELGVILKEIPEGTVCYCCTHEMIKNHIIKKYPDADVTEAYTKDLKCLKKKMKTKKCKQCKDKKCSLLKSDITQFYSIRFVK